ncbi:MAG TPA: peptidase [Ruminococcaceae bacterium]|nr:peptidase [Oscillospiraceae bacterium]
MIYDWTILLMLPGLILGLWAQFRVNRIYTAYLRKPTSHGIPAQELIQRLLAKQGVVDVYVSQTSGTLTDHFDPSTNTLRLSEGVYGSSSVAAIGIAAHEAGHALQKEEGYPWLNLRTALVPMVNISSHLSWPIFLAGYIFSFQPLIDIGIIVFALAVVFSLITLPVEFDASRRANLMLSESGYFSQEELNGVRRVLNAAALTYVASFISILLQFARLILISRRSRRD